MFRIISTTAAVAATAAVVSSVAPAAPVGCRYAMPHSKAAAVACRASVPAPALDPAIQTALKWGKR